MRQATCIYIYITCFLLVFACRCIAMEPENPKAGTEKPKEEETKYEISLKREGDNEETAKIITIPNLGIFTLFDDAYDDFGSPGKVLPIPPPDLPLSLHPHTYAQFLLELYTDLPNIEKEEFAESYKAGIYKLPDLAEKKINMFVNEHKGKDGITLASCIHELSSYGNKVSVNETITSMLLNYYANKLINQDLETLQSAHNALFVGDLDLELAKIIFNKALTKKYEKDIQKNMVFFRINPAIYHFILENSKFENASLVLCPTPNENECFIGILDKIKKHYICLTWGVPEHGTPDDSIYSLDETVAPNAGLYPVWVCDQESIGPLTFGFAGDSANRYAFCRRRSQQNVPTFHAFYLANNPTCTELFETIKNMETNDLKNNPPRMVCRTDGKCGFYFSIKNTFWDVEYVKRNENYISKPIQLDAIKEPWIREYLTSREQTTCWGNVPCIGGKNFNTCCLDHFRRSPHCHQLVSKRGEKILDKIYDFKTGNWAVTQQSYNQDVECHYFLLKNTLSGSHHLMRTHTPIASVPIIQEFMRAINTASSHEIPKDKQLHAGALFIYHAIKSPSLTIPDIKNKIGTLDTYVPEEILQVLSPWIRFKNAFINIFSTYKSYLYGSAVVLSIGALTYGMYQKMKSNLPIPFSSRLPNLSLYHRTNKNNP
jgi:hypothetical protein